MAIAALILAIAICIATHIFLRVLEDARRPRKPPGPKGFPVVGNLNDLPQPGVIEAHHWLKHKELYGPISSVTVLGQTIVIINDARLAFELLEKRSAKHSSRPRQVFAGEMLGWDNSLGLSPYGNRFRTYRKNMSRIIGSKPAAAQYNTLQQAEAGHFLLNVLKNPAGLAGHIRKEAGSIILRIAYGYTAEPEGYDPLIGMAGDAMDKFARAGVPGAFVVDMMPFLRSLPDWVPGTGFKETARKWGAELTDVANKPHAFTKHQIAQGRDGESFLSKLIQAGDMTAEESFCNKWSAMSLYTAGADTTVSAISCFFLAMLAFPEVQKKAQEEIDRVVGKSRLPTAADRDCLPYVDAVVKETLRWHPVAPMGLPHTSTEEDVVEGYRIPKGSMLFANVWHFTHDPDAYDEPMSFMPERFLEANGKSAPDPHDFVFGFGRRICPGRILAENSLYLNIAQSLSVFDISAADELSVRFTPGVVSHPVAYEAVVKPRSPGHEELIRSIERTHPRQNSDADILDSM